MSGHSRWTQIKHKKASSDAKRGALFSKLAREIALAARAGGPNIATSMRLRTAIEHAKNAGLPKENIERAIARAAGDSEERRPEKFFYEATAAGGITILIEGITDNKNRALAEIRHLLGKQDAKLADPGSVLWNFTKVGLIEILREENKTKTNEEMEFAIIEAGANDFRILDDTWLIETDFGECDAVRQKLETLGITIKEVSHDYKPRTPLSIAREEKENVSRLINALLEHDDVQEVYTNIEEY